MRIKKIYLKNYRNYDCLDLDFNDGLNIIIGDNAQGKTNLLEAIYVLAVTKSFLSINDKGLIKFDSRYSLIKGQLENKQGIDDLEILLNDNGKVVKVNNKEIKKLSDYISKMNVVVFSADNIRVFKDSPNSRRKYMNIQISQINNNYLRILNDYNNLLKQRNEFLKIVDLSKKSNLSYLDVLNEKYALLSLEICNHRKKYIDNINSYLESAFLGITNNHGLKIRYVSNVEFLENDLSKLISKLQNTLNRDMQYKMTMIGPNRDDFIFELNGKNLALFGSQGQMRSAVLALKIAEVNYFTDAVGEKPLLLLDDLFSELDIVKKNNLLNKLDGSVQTIITTTDMENISDDIRKKANVYKIKNGEIISREIISEQEG